MPRKRSSTSAERAPAGYLVITAARIPGARRIARFADRLHGRSHTDTDRQAEVPERPPPDAATRWNNRARDQRATSANSVPLRDFQASARTHARSACVASMASGASAAFVSTAHRAYIKRVSEDSAAYEYAVSEHLRMSGIYWAATALDLINANLTHQ